MEPNAPIQQMDMNTLLKHNHVCLSLIIHYVLEDATEMKEPTSTTGKVWRLVPQELLLTWRTEPWVMLMDITLQYV